MMLTEGRSCAFCQKPQQHAQKLIASPDERTHICDACILEPSRLRRAGDARTTTSSLACSFCGKTLCYEGFLVPRIGETSVLICGKCVGIYRKILQKEIKKQSRKS